MSADLGQHRQAYAYCAYCPKVCRFACPVSDATQNETTSTWGKMTEAFLVTTQARPVERSGAEAMHACTGCMRCRTFCRHENEVGFALFSARNVALEQGSSPEGARKTRDVMKTHGNPFGADLHRAAAAFPTKGTLFAGCSALVKGGRAVEDALEASALLKAPTALSDASDRCCGYPLYAAGDIEGFESHAKETARRLHSDRELTVLDPGCAYTFEVVYPRFGVKLRPRVRTLIEALAPRAQDVAKPPLDEAVAYHDACHLGRGLGQYEEPRKLLSAAVRVVREARDNRAEGGCSGGGGLVPRTMPETSVEIARRQAGRLGDGTETVVTACPSSRRMFERAGRKSEDLFSVVRRWLEGTHR